MAAVATSRPLPPATKMKKPSLPNVQTSNHAPRPGPPSSSPSSAAKRLPGQNAPSSTTNVNAASSSNVTRPPRRLHRLSTRTTTTETVPVDRKAMAKKCAEPYAHKESFIMRKFKGRPPSLIVHLHPTHFRFDQQDGSFSYQSEMRVFLDHLAKKTIPHDMLEEFRMQEVQFYDGWLIVRVIDHKSAAAENNASGGSNDDDKPFSIHNHNNFITPSPFAPYPKKEQRADAVKAEKQESAGDNNNLHSDLRSDDTIDVQSKTTKAAPKVFHVALAPTELSRHMDMVIDCLAPDPKTMARKQNQVGSRTPGAGPPSTPIGMGPPTPSTDKPPPAKKQKLRIDPSERLEYEARVVNATAPPLYLDPVTDLDESEQLLAAMQDEWHSAAPPSPKSRKRTVAELAADDAHAKAQERFMLVMDERSGSGGNAANAGGIEVQAGGAHFQPRFEKFNALESIKRDIAEKKQREKEQRLHEDEARRNQQQEEDRRRAQLAQQQQAADQQRRNRMAAAQQQQAAAMTISRQQAQSRVQVNGIPPQMQAHMVNAQATSPIIRQGTPHAASSPIVNNQGGVPMAPTVSQTGQAGSPGRPGSAVQHNMPMVRAPSNSGAPSQSGTPRLAHNTPGVRNSTPVMRQETPSQMTQASPLTNMTAATPQMTQAAMMGQRQMVIGPSGQPVSQAQLADLQRRQMIAAQQQQMLNGQNPQMAQAQMQQLRANHQAQLEANRQQQQQMAAQQAMQGTPQQQHASPAVPQATMNYKEQLAAQMKAQMQGVGQNQQAGGQLTPQQQAQIQQQQQQQQQQLQQARMAQAQQAQQQGQMGPQRVAQNSQIQQLYAQTQAKLFSQLMVQAAQRYGGNIQMIPPHEKHQLQITAQNHAKAQVTQRVRGSQAQAQAQAIQMANMRQAQAQQAAAAANGGQMQNVNVMATPGGQQMTQMHQQNAAQQMQAMHMAQAQNMLIRNAAVQQQQQQQQQQNQSQAAYAQQMNMLQQQQQQQQQHQQNGQR